MNIDTIAHLTCAGHSRAELQAILSELQATGIPAVMALRGDPPRGSHDFVQYPDGFRYASELIDFIRRQYDFKIGCACYPEGHPESANVQQDIEYLKLKQECGADFAVTQLFLIMTPSFASEMRRGAPGDDSDYCRADAGNGRFPTDALSISLRLRHPVQVNRFLAGEANEDVVERGIAYGLKQAEELLEGGVEGIHLYTLNQSRSSTAIIAGLRANGRLTPDIYP